MKKVFSVMMLVLLFVNILTLGFTVPHVQSSEPPATEWNRTYGGVDSDLARSVIQTSDGGYAIAGYTNSFGAVNGDFWLVKTDPSGNMQWNRTYGGTNYDGGSRVVQTIDGGYALIGMTGTSIQSDDWDVFLVKTDSGGNQEWNRTYSFLGNDFGLSIVQAIGGGYVIAGYTGSVWPLHEAETDVLLLKVDPNGNPEWNVTYGEVGLPEAGWSITKTVDCGYAIAGPTNFINPERMHSDFLVIKVSQPCPSISATINIDPDTLNLKSNGQWITAYITLPEGHNVEDIVLETVKVEGIAAAWSEIQNGVYMVKFDRATVQTSLTNEPDYESAPKFYDLTLTVTGELVDGTLFEGTDTITVIKK